MCAEFVAPHNYIGEPLPIAVRTSASAADVAIQRACRPCCSGQLGLVDSVLPQLGETASLLARASEALTQLASKLASRPPPAPVQPAAPSAPPEYLDTKAAAALLGVSAKGLEAMRTRGAGPPYVRIGRRVRYRAADLPGGKR